MLLVNYVYVFILGILTQNTSYLLGEKMGYGYSKKSQIFSSVSTGIIHIFLHYLYNFSIDYIVLSLCSTILINISFIDSDHLEIPDEYSYFILFLATTYLIVKPLEPSHYILGGLVVGGIYLLMAMISNGGLGGADIKIGASLGLILGPYRGFLSIYLTFILAIVGLVYQVLIAIRNKKDTGEFKLNKEMAFGPYIAASAILFFLKVI